jgi:hypothetical protein
MSTIRCVYSREPNFPATDQHPDAVRYTVGQYVVDAIGGEPTAAEVAAFLAPPAREAAKVARAAAVAAITVTTTTGKTFDGDEDSQTRMARAIIGLQAAGVPTITWTLADNTVVAVTLAELTEALILSGQQQAALWPIPE